jgi:hypothetical protein
LLFNIVLETATRRSKVEARGAMLDKLWHILMTWLLWEEEYKMLEKNLHHLPNRQIEWNQK